MDKPDYQAILNTPIGYLGIRCDDNALLGIDFIHAQSELKPKNTIATQTIQQLNHYFKNNQHQFNLPLKLEVTPFQSRVLNALLKIPVGKTKTYGELAKQLKTSPRAIGNACRENPIPVIIPCHRITAQNHLGGYSGQSTGKEIDIKRWLLEHET